MDTLCERIRELRESSGFNQEEIAARLGTSQQYYSKYETGKYDIPLRHLMKLADIYGVSTDYLLGRMGFGQDGCGMVVDDYPITGLVSDVMSLDKEARGCVREYILLWKKAESHDEKN